MLARLPFSGTESLGQKHKAVGQVLRQLWRRSSCLQEGGGKREVRLPAAGTLLLCALAGVQGVSSLLWGRDRH